MEKTCKWCNQIFNFDKPKSFGAHLTNCKMNPKTIERNLQNKNKYSKEYIFNCQKCNKEYSVILTENNYNKGNYKKFCSMNCSNGRIHKQETKDKISKKLFKGGRKMKDKVLKVKKPLFNNCCIFCQKKYQTKKELQKYCSRDCVNRSGINRENGKISASYQNKRSKNEILFSEYCASKFNILTNIPMFNGWDADIIIEDLKIAILWNGIWHYQQVNKNHSLLQVQNRDSIKVSEIEKFGYTAYIIKDMGKYNTKKVESEWIAFNNFISSR